MNRVGRAAVLRPVASPTVGALSDNRGVERFEEFTAFAFGAPEPVPLPVKVTARTMREAIEKSLMQHTRAQLQEILPDDLGLALPDSQPLVEYPTKGTLIGAFLAGRHLPALVDLARRIVEEVRPDPELAR